MPAGLLTLELTESVLLRDPLLAAERMAELRALGLQLAVDDFGTGYSSLTYLRGLPVDEVKIDKGFVDGLASDSGGPRRGQGGGRHRPHPRAARRR